jgi:hypothetical protein
MYNNTVTNIMTSHMFHHIKKYLDRYEGINEFFIHEEFKVVIIFVGDDMTAVWWNQIKHDLETYYGLTLDVYINRTAFSTRFCDVIATYVKGHFLGHVTDLIYDYWSHTVSIAYRVATEGDLKDMEERLKKYFNLSRVMFSKNHLRKIE